MADWLRINDALMKFNALAEPMFDAALGKQTWGDASVKMSAGYTAADLTTSVRRQGGPWLDPNNPFGSFNFHQSLKLFTGQRPYRISPNVMQGMMTTNMLDSMNQASKYGYGFGGGMYTSVFPMGCCGGGMYPPMMGYPYGGGGFWC